MKAAVWIALLGLGLPVYAYLGYPLVLFLLASLVQMGRDVHYLLLRRERRSRNAELPLVNIVIAAHNEEKVIGATLAGCLALDYPRDRLEVIVGSDGSTDRTVEIARQHEGEGVRVLEYSRRRGKVSVISDCAAAAHGDILVFTDANTILDARSVPNLVRHFIDPHVGVVCGELRLRGPDGRPADEGVYWRYEVILKVLESRLNAVLGANGAIYAMRRSLFPEVRDHLITDDFVIPMKVRARGWRVLYDPEAVAVEEVSASLSDEFRRRLRIGAGNWQALRQCAELLAPWRGSVSFAFWSHKVLRWLTPFLLLAALLANTVLLSHPAWQAALAVQIAFYGCAALGLALGQLRLPAGPLRMVSYFVAINTALAIGFVRGACGVQQAAWQSAAREPLPTRGKQ